MEPAADVRFVAVIDAGSAGHGELQTHHAPPVVKGHLRVGAEPGDVVGVEEVELIFLQCVGELAQVVQDPALKILGTEPEAAVSQSGAVVLKPVVFAQKLPHGPPEAEIVHGGVPFAALEVLGTVAPVLGQDVGLGVLLSDGSADLGPELVGELVLAVPGKHIRHVKAPAVDGIGGPQPLAQHGVGTAVDDVPERIAGVIQGGHVVDALPFGVGVARVEEVECPLRGIGVVEGTDGLVEIEAVPVEPAVGGAGVVDGDVQDQLHAVFVEGGAQLGQGLVPAEMFVHVEIVDAVVLVDRGGLEDGI